MKKILIPTDFSENAKKAAEYAFGLFGVEVEMILVHAYQIPHSGANVLISVQDILEKDSNDLLALEKQRLEKLFSGHPIISTQARLGETQEVLRKMIKEVDAELVVMGTQGATGLKGILVGSVAASVMERVRIPVLAIPLQAEVMLPNNIAFAADDRSLNELKLPELIVSMAVKNMCKLHVVNVVKEGEAGNVGSSAEAHSKPIGQLEGVEIAYHFLEDNDVIHALDTFLSNNKMDMLALVNRKQDLFSMLFNRSVTKSMMLHSKTPILAIPQ